MPNQPPKILRIKRKRHQDPLQALILEDRRSAKRSKPSSPSSSPKLSPISTPRRIISAENLNYVFKLARTDESNKVNANDESILNTILAESQHGSIDESPFPENNHPKRNFIIPKHQIEEDIEIPNELSDMIDNFLTLEHEDGKKKRKLRGGKNRRASNDSSSGTSSTIRTQLINNKEVEESQYVYDVYQLIDSEPLTSANHPLSQIGYIRFFEDENDQSLLMNDEEDENRPSVLTDDEDSNAESFYQNDYPSDEDDGGFIINQDDELNNDDDVKNNHTGIHENNDDDDDDDDYDDNEGYVPHDGVGFSGNDEYYDYEELENLDNEDYYYGEDEDEDGNNMNDQKFKRNKFFDSDVSDPIAIHRDKIFGKLEKMINKNNNKNNSK